MPVSQNTPAYQAAAHRRRLLQRTRAISLGTIGAAAIASLALGTAFAHAIPGHARVVGTQGAPASGAGTGLPSAPAPPPRPAQQPGRGSSATPAHARRHIAPPPQPPASTPAAPQVSSGGS
jgi:hypothetical protein